MRRRKQPTSGAAGVSLFPFLAVLLCTMGALIVVLIVIARQSRPDLKESEADVASAAARKEWETKQSDLEWRIEQLRSSRQMTLDQLDKQRQELSHLEDHARRLRGQLEELENARREFDKLASGERLEHDRLKQEIADAERKIAAKKAEIDEAKRKAGGGGGTYAVVPYHGPNETRRRPIYIECRGDGVVLQPEGLVLTEKDFEGDLGPGNPLASALRAAREYLSRTQMPGEGAPYPLLLIRPDGIIAYECVIAAMSSWGSEFGYELIGQDWPLEFPPPDPQLALAMRQAIGEGRLRQAYLARAAPRLLQAGQHATFRASPTGGLMRDDGIPLGREPQLGGRNRSVGRPALGRGGSGSGGAGRDRIAGSGSGSGSGGSSSKKLSGNPYRAALAGQGGGSASGVGVGGGAAGDRVGSLLGSASGGGDSLLAGGGGRGDGLYGAASATGDRYGRGGSGLGSAPGGGTGDSLLGGGGAQTGRKSGLLASSAGRSNRYASGGAGATKTGERNGAAPGTGAKSATGAGRGWGMAQGTPASRATGAAAGAGGMGGAGAGDAASAAATQGGAASGGSGPNQAGSAKGGVGEGGRGEKGVAGSGGESGGAKGDAAAGEGPLLTGDPKGASSGGNSKSGSAEGGALSDSASGAGNSMAQAGSSASRYGKSGGGAGGGNGKGLAGSPNGGAGSSSGGSGGQGAGGSQAPQPGTMGVPGMPDLTIGNPPKSIAEQRGERNWANPAANHYSFPVTRPIKVVCDADHLTLLPDGRSRRGYKVIELNDNSDENVRDLVESVWDRVETWGAAGQGMYWRPELLMEIEPGGERRFAELKALLADSGLDVQGRPRRTPIVRYPRTKNPN